MIVEDILKVAGFESVTQIKGGMAKMANTKLVSYGKSSISKNT